MFVKTEKDTDVCVNRKRHRESVCRDTHSEKESEYIETECVY